MFYNVVLTGIVKNKLRTFQPKKENKAQTVSNEIYWFSFPGYSRKLNVQMTFQGRSERLTYV